MLMDFMPNEQRIILRGPSYKMMWRDDFLPLAEARGFKLSYKTWRSCVTAALRIVESNLPGQLPNTLRMSRAAKHSNFPECTECQTLRKAYLAVARAPGADQKLVESARLAVMDHNKMWQEDRREALNLRRNTYQEGSEQVYQCDDKCGSFWCKLPVDETGR